MPLKAPRMGHAVRSLVNVDEVVGMTLTAYKLLPSVGEARREAKTYLRARTDDCVHQLVRHQDGQVLLMTFGRNGGYKTRWNFGRHPEMPRTVGVPAELRGGKVSIISIDEWPNK